MSRVTESWPAPWPVRVGVSDPHGFPQPLLLLNFGSHPTCSCFSHCTRHQPGVSLAVVHQHQPVGCCRGDSPTTLPVPASATAPVIEVSLSQSTSTNINQSDAAESLDVNEGDSAPPDSAPPSYTNSQPDPSDINTDSAASNAGALGDIGNTSDPSRLKAIEDGATNDVTMCLVTPAVSPLPKSRNDDNLPTWLTQMIKYLRNIAEDTAWQDLVTEFVDFERHEPPNGVSFTVSFMYFFIEYLFRRTEPSYQVETQGGFGVDQKQKEGSFTFFQASRVWKYVHCVVEELAALMAQGQLSNFFPPFPQCPNWWNAAGVEKRR